MKQRIAELEKFGVKEADLSVMEQDADKAIEMIREVEPPPGHGCWNPDGDWWI